jgi:phosphomannomutase
MSLMVSISGIRGIVGESFTPEVAIRYAAAFARYCWRGEGQGPEIVIGRDGRSTGSAVADAVRAALLSSGVSVRDLGICPTPTVELAVERERAAGGISITASHNPAEWNGLKFLGPSGMFLDAEENRRLWQIAAQSPQYSPWNATGRTITDTSWLRKHLDIVLRLPLLDLESLRRRRFRVVLDCVNAAGGLIVPELLRAMGCEVLELNCEVNGVFAHTPEPLPENLTSLCQRVAEEHADLGIAVDPDVDRLVLITEAGKPYGEENTVASAVLFMLERSPGQQRVVVNLSTTRAVDDIARRFGAEVVRTPVGEINVARKMKEIGALIGGEGSGGVILPMAHLGRDAIVGIGLLLQLLADSGKSLSALRDSLPPYAIAKGKVEVAGRDPRSVLDHLRTSLRDGTINTDDGLKIDFEDHWVHLRRSNTEPIIRIIAEAPTSAQAGELVRTFRQRIQAAP